MRARVRSAERLTSSSLLAGDFARTPFSLCHTPVVDCFERVNTDAVLRASPTSVGGRKPAASREEDPMPPHTRLLPDSNAAGERVLRRIPRATAARSRGRRMRAIRLLVFTAALACATTATAAAQELAPRDIAARTRPAVVMITAFANGEATGRGSGFFVRPDGTLVTNHHVIANADALRVQLASGEVFDRVFYLTSDERRDIALLRVPVSRAPVLEIGDDQQAEVGDAVFVMGNPLGLDGTFSSGLISARRMVDGVALVQISAPISSGSSGGPVLNAAGQVIGIATLTMTEGQNLNMAVPARYAAGLLAMNEPAQPFEQVAAGLRSRGPTGGQPATPPGRSGGRQRDDRLELWQRVLLAEYERIKADAEQRGLAVEHEPYLDMLDDGEYERIEFVFDRVGFYTVRGVCDVDCSDLDLWVLDGTGSVIDRDLRVSDRPQVRFRVTRPGSFEVVVRMAECSREPCGFVVQSFRER
jgi:hypothetical protein